MQELGRELKVRIQRSKFHLHKNGVPVAPIGKSFPIGVPHMEDIFCLFVLMIRQTIASAHCFLFKAVEKICDRECMRRLAAICGREILDNFRQLAEADTPCNVSKIPLCLAN